MPNDSTSVILDASVGNGSSYYRTPSSKVAVYMPYGTLYGIATCLSSDFGTTGANEETSQMGIYTDNNGVLVDNGSIVVGGENNGSYCWCRITYPVVSNWAYIAGPSWYQKVNTSCVQECNADCGWHIANYSQKRKRLFNLL